ncbi:MAG: UbiD family decarboxylase [Chloroflexi bacterium]|nr:UbiD family decarboxylase [Chloroflexota bacterium]
MAYKDLREFIALLEQKGHLVRVKAEVNPSWEINGITNKLTRENGPAVLFENAGGHKVPVLSELLGRSQRRYALALGLDTDDVRVIRDEWLKRINHPITPRLVKTGPCKENILTGDRADLNAIFPPVLWHKGDGAPFVGTQGLQVTRDPETGVQNTGVYRQMVFSKNETSLMMQPFQHGAQHLQKWVRLYPGKPMPVAVVIGPEPCYLITAGGKFSHPPSEDAYAGGLRQEPLDLVKCETCNLEVPATAEIILEGEVFPEERRTDGPFGEFTGFIGGLQACNVFHLKAITHRHSPIFQGEREGYPSEGGFISATGMEYLLYQRLKHVNGFLDVHLPLSGCLFEAIVSMRVLRRGQPFQMMQRIWGDPEVGGYIKHIIAVDEGVDIRDRDEVAWAIATHVQADRDVVINPRCPETSLDVSQIDPARRLAAKMGIDATFPVYEYRDSGKEPPVLCSDLDILAKVKAQWGKYGI